MSRTLGWVFRVEGLGGSSEKNPSDSAMIVRATAVVPAQPLIPNMLVT